MTLLPSARRRVRRFAALPVVLLVAIVALGFAVRIGLVLRGGGLLGIGAYDDGVYYAGAARLLHGDLPYRDFLFLQPPGIVVVLAPFAALARLVGDPFAIASMRVSFELLGGLNAGLVFLVLRRFGTRAALIGGVFYAVFYPAAFDERTALLEPIGSTGVLVALLLLGRWREGLNGPRAMLAAGAALGVAIDMKIWFVVPTLVVVAFAHGARRRLLIGAAAAGVVGYLPFFLAAPARSIQQIVLDQTGRSRSGSIVHRFESFLGLAGNGLPGALPHLAPAALVPPAAIVLGLLVAVAWRDRRARAAVTLLAVAILVLTLSPVSYTHYASLVAVPLALVLGIAASRSIGRIERRPLRIAAVVGVLLVAVGLSARNDLHGTDVAVPLPALRAATADIRGCIVSDDPTLLAVIGVLTPDLDRGCKIRPDMSGVSFDPSGRPPGARPGLRNHNPVYQREVLRYLRSGAAFLEVRDRTGLSHASERVLEQQRILHRDGTWILREGTDPEPPSAAARTPLTTTELP